MSNWTWNDDYSVAYARTSDPRVLAVIKRDDYATFEQNLDGDAINPTYLIDRDTPSHIGGYEDDIDLVHRIIEASYRFKYAAGYRHNGLSYDMMDKAQTMIDRWLWIFHGTTFSRSHYGYNGEYDIITINTPEFRKHVGIEEITQEQALEDVKGMEQELANIADGEVFGIGWATYEERVLETDDDIDLDEWDVEIACWGYVGVEYAQESAERWEAGAPELPTMLAL